MAEKKTDDAPERPENDADVLKGWTAQQDPISPALAPDQMPQQFTAEELPDAEEMEKTGLTIPEIQLAEPSSASAATGNVDADADLDSMTKAELEAEASSRGVEVSSSMTKAEMIDAIEAAG